MANDPQDRLITVSAARLDGRVALWERHPDHPQGEVLVTSGSGPVLVARTPGVLRALADGRLVLAPPPDNAPVVTASAPVPSYAAGKRKAAVTKTLPGVKEEASYETNDV